MMTEQSPQRSLEDRLVREGDAWVLLMLSGNGTQADAEALRQWRSRSPAHEHAFREAVRLRTLIRVAGGELRGWTGPLQRVGMRQHGASGAKINRRAFLAGGLAASVLSGFGALQLLRREPAADFTTAKGERRTLALSAGISIELNTLSRLRRRPDVGAHAVELLSGEAMMEARMPQEEQLIALAGPGRTQARAARFSLRCVAGAICVSCLEGEVVVQAGGAGRRLQAGQQVSYAQDGIGAVAALDKEAVTGWEHGVLLFRRETVSTVIAEINRYRPGRIMVANATLAARRIDGTFYVGQLDQIFSQLQAAFGTRVIPLPGGVVVLV